MNTTARSGSTTRSPDRPADDPDTSLLFQRLRALEQGPERERIREQLVRAWLPMARRIADKYRERGESREDLRQVAAMGLVGAINRYDPASGPFAAFAVPTISGEIKRHFRDFGWDLHVPRRVQDARNKVRRAQRELQAVGGGEPSLIDIAERARISVEQVRAGLEAMDAYNALSLDRSVSPGAPSDEVTTLYGAVGQAEGGYDLVVDRESVRSALAALPDREKTILYLRFFHDMPQARIAERFGISQMHVSRIITKTCARIRIQVMDTDDDPAAQHAA
ncbi:SigB/SigF/SigG family RNA polymerase sigma factor [Streptomyces sp. NPDC001941]|uniref:SigB/SigF/SigG family RNA polymerase sigma factor n=1 Tax=Streptomyces sp. NPDC001941 TaxID=3154659 RepID=UPI003320D75B